MSKVNMLSLDQERENNRDIKLQEFLLENQKEYETYIPFNKVVQLLFGNIARVSPLIPAKGKKGIIVTEQKTDFKSSLASNVNIVCTAATKYAISIADKDLQYAVRFRASDITNAKDGNVSAIVTTITDALTPLLSVPAFIEYEITADMLSALTRGAEDFSDTRGKAAVIDTDSNIVNDDLNQIFKDIRSNIASLRRLLLHFSTKNPNFVKGFNTSAAVDYTGIRRSGIEGIVINPLTGAPIEDATITGVGEKKIATTDSKGYYKLIRLKITDMKITFAAPGFDTQVIEVKIIRSRIITLNMSLQGKVISLSATA